MSELDIKPQVKNANRHTARGMQALERSLDQDGWIGAITVAADGEAFDGSARVEKTAENGMLDDPIVVDSDGTRPIVVRRTDIPSATDARAVRLGISANRVAALNLEWEPDILAGIAEMGVDLGALFTKDEWADVTMPALPEAGDGGDEFDPTPDDGPTRTALGELWIIGGVHRLLVGDCTDAANVARLMDGERAQGVFTSPPYAEQRADQYESIPADKYVKWFKGVADSAKAHLVDDGSFFLNIKPHCEDGERVLYVFDLVLAMRRAWGWRFIDEFCWTRNGFPGGYDNRFKNGFEPVYHFSMGRQIEFQKTNVAARRAPDTHVYGKSGSGSGFQSVVRDTGTGVLPSNVLNIETGEVNIGTRGHPATFPLGLPDFFIRAFSSDGAIWFDPFLGSGTTLIAAHRTGRRCYGMEIAPKYADVILRRAEAEGLACERVDTL